MHFISKRAVILGVVASLGFAGTAQAATDDTSIQLDAGALAVTSPAFSDFTTKNLTGAIDATHATDMSNWTASNPGGEAGWKVTMDASDLIDPNSGSPVTMDGAVLSVADSTATPVDVANDSTVPTTTGGAISSGLIVANVAPLGGLGNWNFAQVGAVDFTLETPADARAGTYASTITTTITLPA